MNHRPISKIGWLALAIGAAGVILTLLLLVRPTQALIGSGTTVILPAGRGIATTHAATSANPWTEALTMMSNAGSIGMVSGAADGIYDFTADRANMAPRRIGTSVPTHFTADLYHATAADIGKTSLADPPALSAATLRAAAVSTYYRAVAAVMAVFGLIAIVTGCIALRRSTVRRDAR